MDNEKFGAFIAKLRKEHILTQQELAQKINLTNKAISKWERGLSFPDISMLEILAETLDVSVLELLRGEKLKQEDLLTHEEAKQLIKNSINISDVEICRKQKRSRIIIMFIIMVLMLLVSLSLNIFNYLVLLGG